MTTSFDLPIGQGFMVLNNDKSAEGCWVQLGWELRLQWPQTRQQRGPCPCILPQCSTCWPPPERPRALPGLHFCFGTDTHGFAPPVSHLYFHTVLEADHRAQGRRRVAPGGSKRISVSLWSCPGPVVTQKESRMTPTIGKRQISRSNCTFRALTTKFKLFQSYWQPSIGQIYLHPSSQMTLS